MNGLAGLVLDASELQRLGNRMDGLSRRLKHQVVRRAMSTVLRRMRAETIRSIVAGTDARPSTVRSKVRAFNAGGGAVVTVKSRWVPLIELGAARPYGPKRLRDAAGRYSGGQNRGGGVTVRGWGRHEGAFLATMASGHKGVFRRVGKERLPIRELWGPNPAQHVVNREGEYLGRLAEIVQAELIPELDRQIDLALGGM